MSYALIGTEFERQISQAEFLAIQTAKQDVIFATVAEETFIVVTQNFNEFELELLQAAQMRIASGLGDYAESMDLRLAIDRRAPKHSYCFSALPRPDQLRALRALWQRF